MVAFPTYDIGTVSIASGSTTLTGSGVIWSGVNARSGDTIYIDGVQNQISDVTDTNHIELIQPSAAAKAAVSYVIVQDSSLRYVGAQAMADVSNLVSKLNTEGLYLYIPSDATDPTAIKTVADDGQYAFQASTGKLWLMEGGAWVFVGTYKGFQFKGAYDAGTAYAVNDIITSDGSAYIIIAPTTGNAPPNAAYYALLTAAGAAATVSIGTTTTGAAGSNATVTNSGTTTAAVFDFSIPKGQGIQPDATGTASDKTSHDGEAKGFVFLQTDVVPFALYIKASATSGDWAGPTYISAGTIFYAADFGVLLDGTDNTDKVQAALDAVAAAGGGILLFGPGRCRCDNQLTYDGDSLTFVGSGKGGPDDSSGTVLDLRYGGPGHKILIGNGSTRRDAIRFTNLRLTDGASTSNYVFETRYVRGFSLDHITFAGIYGLAKLGRSGEVTSVVTFGDGIEGNMNGSLHEHFMDCVNVTGPLFVSGSSHVEGASTVIANTCFMNFGTTATRPDGVQMSGWTVRLFDRGVSLHAGCANTMIRGNIFDQIRTVGVYADTDVGAITGLMVQGNKINGYDVTVSSSAIQIFQTTSSATEVKVDNNSIKEFGDEGAWVSGAMDVSVLGNTIKDTGQRTNNNFAGLRIGAGVSGVAQGNVINSTTTNRTKYGVQNDSTSTTMRVHMNTSIGHATAGVWGWCDESAFKATKGGTDQTGIASATPTKVTFGTEAYQVGGQYDAVNSRWTPAAGIARPFARVRFSSANVVDQAQYIAMIYKNGSELTRNNVNASGTTAVDVPVFTDDVANGTDYYEIYCQGGGAGNKTIDGGIAYTQFFGSMVR